jgi:ribosomal protein S12 methylthiotransferase accessory factor YcaO
LAIRVRGTGARAFFTAGADIEPEKACLRALSELCRFRPWLTAERAAELRTKFTDPAAIVGIEGHMDLYALDESFAAFDYLELGHRPPVALRDLGRDSPIPTDPQLRLDLVLQSLDLRLRDVGAAIYVKDLTHTALVECGLRVVRAVTPGLYPVWFGGLFRRFAVTERLRKLAERYTGRPFQHDLLQLAPHPLP